MNMRSGSERSEKCHWYQIVDEFMSDRTHVMSHAYASATKQMVRSPQAHTSPTPRNTMQVRQHQNLPSQNITKTSS